MIKNIITSIITKIKKAGSNHKNSMMKKIKIFNLEIKRDHLESKDVIEVKNFQENKDFLDNKNLIENIEILGNLDNPDNLDNLESLDKKNNKKKKDKILIIGKVREIVKSRII
jgi:hypothetical protein